MRFGIDVLLNDLTLRKKLQGKRLALLAHPASVTSHFVHSLEALKNITEFNLTAAIGPQHGMKGDKQDNMEESEDYIDPIYQIPVFSLYGKYRTLTQEMLDTFDCLIFDVQDVGTRVYTFLTTLYYVLEACAKAGKAVYILDRPNPAGREIEGSLLDPKHWSSFVGVTEFPMRHGLTLIEAAHWIVKNKGFELDLTLVPMENYNPTLSPGFGWPLGKFPWINPSPNIPQLSAIRCYPGTVLLEGTTLSEGRGTTRPFEMIGAPDIDGHQLLNAMEQLQANWMQGCKLRACYFQPTFQKHMGKLCSGFQIHTEDNSYEPAQFKPYRLIALALKAVRKLNKDYPIWRDFHYEYEKERLAIDIINGGKQLREWVDNEDAEPADFEKLLRMDENAWKDSRKEFLFYPE